MSATPATCLRRDRPFVQAVARPIAPFLQIEAARGVVLLAAAVVAVGWANSPWSASYDQVWSTEVTLMVGRHVVEGSLRHWINGGLMVLFFFVLGLEIRQALVGGQLASRRAAVVPVIGAAGGMVLPAAIYLAINHGGGRAPPRGVGRSAPTSPSASGCWRWSGGGRLRD